MSTHSSKPESPPSSSADHDDWLRPSTDTAHLAVLQQQKIIPLSDENRKTTTRQELWAYYAYYIGCSGTGPLNFGPAQFQNLLEQNAFDPFTLPWGTAPCRDSGSCAIKWGRGTKSVNSVILDASGISFAIQLLVFLLAGSTADYGRWRPYVLMVATALGIATGFAWIAIDKPSKYVSGIILYITGLVAYQVALGYYFAAFPGLARDLPEMHRSEMDVMTGLKTPAEHSQMDMLERNHISNTSLVWSSAGSVLVLAVAVGILYAVGTETNQQNNHAYSVLIGYFTAIWVVFAIPWFVLEQHRPGARLPRGSNYLTIGFIHVYQAFREIWKLRQTLLYFVAYFFINDSLNTAGIVINILQNRVIQHESTTLVYLFIAAFGCQAIGVYACNYCQRRWKISTKRMVLFTAVGIFVMCLWGLLGLWTDKVGYHNVWEFWLFQSYVGLVIGGWNSYSNTMISEVSPAPKMFLFFSLFSIVGKCSTFVGPLVASAIVAKTHNTNSAFIFLTITGALGVICLALVNVTRSQIECKDYLANEVRKLYPEHEITFQSETSNIVMDFQ